MAGKSKLQHVFLVTLSDIIGETLVSVGLPAYFILNGWLLEGQIFELHDGLQFIHQLNTIRFSN